eukprot:scaffold104589_cov30-Tisochrysis_lutea.AAC.4
MGGRLAPAPSKSPTPLAGGLVGHPHALPFGTSWAHIDTTQTPSWRGWRATIPRPCWPCPLPFVVVESSCALDRSWQVSIG